MSNYYAIIHPSVGPDYLVESETGELVGIVDQKHNVIGDNGDVIGSVDQDIFISNSQFSFYQTVWNICEAEDSFIDRYLNENNNFFAASDIEPNHPYFNRSDYYPRRDYLNISDCNVRLGAIDAPAAHPAGDYTAADPIVGVQLEDSHLLRDLAHADNKYEGFFNDIYWGMYLDEYPVTVLMVPRAFTELAFDISYEYLVQSLSNLQGLSQENAFHYEDHRGGGVRFFSFPELVHDIAYVTVQLQNHYTTYQDNEYASLAPICALHELGHVARSSISERIHYDELARYVHAAQEMSNICMEIVVVDDILREIYQNRGVPIPFDEPLDYRTTIITEGSNSIIEVGELAVLLRSLLDQYGSIDLALASPEFEVFLGERY